MHKEAAIREPHFRSQDLSRHYRRCLSSNRGQSTKNVVYPIRYCFGHRFVWCRMYSLSIRYRCRCLGIEQNHWMGLGYNKLRMVGRYWSRRNIDFCSTSLFRQKWRTAINRSAEAMTIFAVFMAGLFPLIHMGRLWLGYWVLPLPNQFGSLWANFNSPLLWDVFAISTYLSVSLVFWYIGLIPDFATIRDRAKKPIAKKCILSFPLDGLEERSIGIDLNWFHWYWLVWQHHLYSLFTLLYLSISPHPLFLDGTPRFSSLLRCRGGILRFCNGTNTNVGDAESDAPRGIHSYKAR